MAVGHEGEKMWQKFAAHGLQPFANARELELRMRELDSALGELCLDIASVAGASERGGLERARQLRTKPAQDEKSHYECLNQLIHYWYCCASAKHLAETGCTAIYLRPTAEDNQSTQNDAFDVVASSSDGAPVVAEVFCVSKALWRQKIGRTYSKLMKAPAEAHRLIFYNCDAKPTYQAKKAGVYFLSVQAPSGKVDLACSTDNRPLNGIWPNKAMQATCEDARA